MWLKKLDELDNSGYGQLNFLWKDEIRPIYWMDNHLGALWCWLRELNPEESYTLIHIDYHWDALPMFDDSIERLRSINLESIDDYLALRHPNDQEKPLMRWDNYIDPLPKLRPQYKSMYFHALESEKHCGVLNDQRSETSYSTDWWENLDFWKCELEDTRLVLNFDLDYFFINFNHEYVQAFSDTFVKLVCSEFINPNLRPDTILTVAWSPECCGGWRQAAEISRLFCNELQIPFPHDELRLPF